MWIETSRLIFVAAVGTFLGNLLFFAFLDVNTALL